MAEACAATGARVREFHVAPLYPTPESSARGHQWFVEFQAAPKDDAAFVEALDRTLQARNVDYEEHRLNDVDLPLPWLVPVPVGTFATLLRQRARETGRGAQRKLPRVQNDRRLADAIVALLPAAPNRPTKE